jgi:hypothetical protein
LTARPPLDRLLAQMDRMARDGDLGPTAQEYARAYDACSSDVQRSLAYVTDFYASAEAEVAELSDYLVKIVMLPYRESKKHDPDVASAYALAFVRDYPGTSGTTLLSQWSALGEAIGAFKSHGSKDRASAWQTSSRVVLSLNEFLNALVGLMVVAWRCGLGKTVNPNVLKNPYGSKVHEFGELTGGVDGLFGGLLKLAQPRLRNGLGHGTAWPDYEAGLIRYTDGRDHVVEYTMDYVEFFAYVHAAGVVAQAYIAALNSIVVMESSDSSAVSAMPPHLQSFWNA